MSKKKLTHKQKKFVHEYLKCFNAAEAARRAGYSVRTAKEMGMENLTKPHILEYMKSIEKKSPTKIPSEEEILMALADIARGDLGDALHIDGTYCRPDIQKLKDSGKTKLLKKYKQGKYGPEFELYNSHEAWRDLARYRSLFKDKLIIEQKLVIEVVELLKAGQVEPQQVIDKFGDEMAQQFFAKAGITVNG